MTGTIKAPETRDGELRLAGPELEQLLEPAGDVEPYPDNPRRGDPAAILESMVANGIYRPIIVQRSTGWIIAGNHTYEALRRAGADRVPVLRVDVDDRTARRILLADNRLAELGTYDTVGLAELLKALDGRLEGTGYSREDADEIMRVLNAGEDAPELGVKFGTHQQWENSQTRTLILELGIWTHTWVLARLGDVMDETGAANSAEALLTVIREAREEHAQ